MPLYVPRVILQCLYHWIFMHAEFVKLKSPWYVVLELGDSQIWGDHKNICSMTQDHIRGRDEDPIVGGLTDHYTNYP